MSEDYSGDNARYPNDEQRDWQSLATGDRVAVLLLVIGYIITLILN
jgi:hypothetical protein